MPRRAAMALALAAAIGVLASASPAIAAPRHSAVAGAVARATATKLHLTLTSPGNPIAADWITATGTASAKLKGAKVTVQRREGSKAWAKVATVKVSKKGTFTVRTRATGVGSFSYRVTSAKTKKAAAGKSNSIGVTVYRWYVLSTLGGVASSGDARYDAITMAGQFFFQSVLLEGDDRDTSWVDYNASYKCSTFQATVGVADTADAGTTVHHSFLVDSTEVASADTVLGKTAPVQVDISGAFRVRLQSQFTIPGSSDYTNAGWGNARMLCRGDPSV